LVTVRKFSPISVYKHICISFRTYEDNVDAAEAVEAVEAVEAAEAAEVETAEFEVNTSSLKSSDFSKLPLSLLNRQFNIHRLVTVKIFSPITVY